MKIYRPLSLIALAIASPAFGAEGGEQPDPVMIQRQQDRMKGIEQKQQTEADNQKRLFIEMQRARDERANEVIIYRAEVSRLTEDAAKSKARIEELEKQLAEAKAAPK
jgi:hypothetical protein